MRRIATWILVAAVVVIGLAASIDALRGGSLSERATVVEPGSTTTGAPAPQERTLVTAAADLRRAGVPEGRILYWNEVCSASVLTLPDLAQRPPRAPDPCRFAWARGRWVETFGPAAENLRGVCRRNRLELWTGPYIDPDLYARERGCGAAWKPDGAVTFIRKGEVRRFVRCPGDGRGSPLLCSKPLLTRAQLARQLRERGWAAVEPRITELVWLDGRSFAAILEQRTPEGPSDSLALFEGGQLVHEPVGPYDQLGGLTPSPTGRRVAAFRTDRGGIVAVDRAGTLIPLALDRGSGIAWSTDENWIAEAAEDGIWVFRTDEESPKLIQIPAVARDLLWLGP
jgi:hypothetical protein